MIFKFGSVPVLIMFLEIMFLVSDEISVAIYYQLVPIMYTEFIPLMRNIVNQFGKLFQSFYGLVEILMEKYHTDIKFHKIV